MRRDRRYCFRAVDLPQPPRPSSPPWAPLEVQALSSKERLADESPFLKKSIDLEKRRKDPLSLSSSCGGRGGLPLKDSFLLHFVLSRAEQKYFENDLNAKKGESHFFADSNGQLGSNDEILLLTH